jgi:hypothetical protein
MSPSPPELIALTCRRCGRPLEVSPRAALFPCRHCGVFFEPEGSELRELIPRTAELTTGLAIPPEVRYLATWAFLASVEVREKRTSSGGARVSVWEQIREVAAPRPPFLFVPAFALARVVVKQLGSALVEAQPQLVLEEGIPPEGPLRPVLVEAEEKTGGKGGRQGSGPGGGRCPSEAEELGEAPEWTVSPVLLSRRDAETVAHFVYLAVENRATPDLRGIDYDLSLTGAELLLIPAVYDQRYARDSNWRFLLEEFDGLVA